MKKTLFAIVPLIFYIFIAGLIAAHADSPIGIRLAEIVPHSRTANRVLAVRIEKNDFNREVGVGCESEEGFAVFSAKELEGSRDHRTVLLFEFYLDEGTYYCEAMLNRGDSSTFSAKTKFFVYR